MGHGRGRCPKPIKEEGADGGAGDGGFGGGNGGWDAPATTGGGDWNTGAGDSWNAGPATAVAGGDGGGW